MENNVDSIVNLVEFENSGLNFETALYEANSQNLRILSNVEVNQLLSNSRDWTSSLYPVWTGTLVAHASPGKSFEDFVSEIDQNTGIEYRLQVPEEFQGKTDCALALNHGFILKNGSLQPVFDIKVNANIRNIVLPSEVKLELLEDFPREFGWYLTDEKFGIPFGEKVSFRSRGARYLWRAQEKVGFLIRGGKFYSRNGFGDIVRQSGEFGVLAVK